MKIIATRIPTPFDEKATQMYENEFRNNEKGIVLFPDESINSNDLLRLVKLSDKYNISIVGTVKEIPEEDYRKSLILSSNNIDIGPLSYTGPFIEKINAPPTSARFKQIITLDETLHQFYKADIMPTIKVGKSEFKSIIRIGADIGLPCNHFEIADLLLIPSSSELPKESFTKVNHLLRNLNSKSIIVYSPLARQESKHKKIEMGIYNVLLHQIGRVKDDYSVLNINQ